jgi:general L-amino acid transport system permease protein
MESNTRQRHRRKLTISLGDRTFRAIVIQVVVVGVVLLAASYLVANTLRNLDLRGIATGFGFLWREAGLPIAESPIAYAPTDSYGRALLIGILNTLKVAAIGIVLATVLGTAIGIARLSKNWLLARASAIYVELLRDLPLLLQLLFWYTVLQMLPGPRAAFQFLPGIYLSNRGLVFPSLLWDGAHLIILGLVVLGLLLAIAYRRHARAAQARDGRYRPVWPTAVLLMLFVPILAWIAFDLPTQVDAPVLRGFNFRGGALVSPEFFALLLGLVTYTAAFIAEIVRSGIIAVSPGQWEAGRALGLPMRLILGKIVLPQALRVIIPPMTSQYLNLTKNSSLAVAIGYQDIVSIANTTLNQTGQAIEGIAIIMAVYLSISLSISLFMNWFDRRVALKGRGA